jgi:hypothetical protein
MKTRSIKAYAIVNKKEPVISVFEIYKSKDIMCMKHEKIIRVEIKEIEK